MMFQGEKIDINGYVDVYIYIYILYYYMMTLWCFKGKNTRLSRSLSFKTSCQQTVASRSHLVSLAPQKGAIGLGIKQYGTRLSSIGGFSSISGSSWRQAMATTRPVRWWVNVDHPKVDLNLSEKRESTPKKLMC